MVNGVAYGLWCERVDEARLGDVVVSDIVDGWVPSAHAFITTVRETAGVADQLVLATDLCGHWGALTRQGASRAALVEACREQILVDDAVVKANCDDP